ncbi:MAG TPA: PilZ domain-containing protein, partial [Bacillota bacterium]|nr:PilZ domain-containing protein [Bacillota bacterium]
NHFGNKLIRKTTVNRLDECNLFLNLPEPRSIFGEVSPNTELVLVCKQHEEQAEYVFSTKYLKIMGTHPPLALLQAPSGFKKGRQAIRFDVAVPFSYFVNNKEVKDGVVRNLSMNGLLASVKANPALQVNDHLVFKLFLPTSAYPLLLTGNIVRITKQEPEYQLGIHFPYLSFELQDKIVKFLFSAQKTMAPRNSEPKPATLPETPLYRKIG